MAEVVEEGKEAEVEEEDDDDEVVAIVCCCCVVGRSEGGVAADWPTSADSSPCPGAIPAGRLLGRFPAADADPTANGKVEQVEVEVEEEETS